MTDPSAGGTRRCSALAFSLGLLAAPAAAQQDSLIDPGDAQVRRQIRSLESRTGSSASTELQLRQARQSLTARSRGVYLTPEQARLDRNLNRIGRDLRRRPGDDVAERQPVVRKPDPLPSSLETDDGTGGGRQSSAVTVTRLLDRAENALGDQRSVQARSDLSTARGFLDDLDPDAPATRATYAKLQTRLTALQQRVDAAEDG